MEQLRVFPLQLEEEEMKVIEHLTPVHFSFSQYFALLLLQHLISFFIDASIGLSTGFT